MTCKEMFEDRSIAGLNASRRLCYRLSNPAVRVSALLCRGLLPMACVTRQDDTRAEYGASHLPKYMALIIRKYVQKGRVQRSKTAPTPEPCRCFPVAQVYNLCTKSIAISLHGWLMPSSPSQSLLLVLITASTSPRPSRVVATPWIAVQAALRWCVS
jgi:hypothetical protein